MGMLQAIGLEIEEVRPEFISNIIDITRDWKFMLDISNLNLPG